MKLKLILLTGLCMAGSIQAHEDEQLYHNSRYVDKSLITVDLMSKDFKDFDFVTRNMMYGAAYGIILPIARTGEFYAFPSYQTFSRLITNPTVIWISLLAGIVGHAAWEKHYKQNNKKEDHQEMDDLN